MPSVSPSPFLPFSPPKERSGSRRFALEGLEPRWLLSATPAAAALQAAWPAPEQDRLWQEAAAPKLSAEPTLRNTAADYAPKPDYRPLTKFEHRGLKLGHGVWDLVFQRR